MALLKKTLFDEKLETYNVLVEDTADFSDYFKITELPDVFTGGKNAFLIQGSPELVADSIIKIQIKDSQGNIIYHEPGEGIPEYYEGTSKVVAVYIYPDTSFGPCTITILGELKEYYSNRILNPVPSNWENTYNVRWQKQVNVNPLLQNTSKIRFYRRPKVNIEETILPIYNRTVNRVTISGSVDGIAINPIEDTNFRTFKGDTIYELKISGSNFSSSMEGETIIVSDLNQSYSTTIKDVLTSNRAYATLPYYETSSATSPQIVTEFSSASFELAYNESVTLTNSSVSSSFAKIKLTDLDTFSGDVNRLKIFASRKADIGNYTLLEDIQLESTELLQTDDYSGSIAVRTGQFTSNRLLNDFWFYRDYGTLDILPISVDNTVLASSVKLLDKGVLNTTINHQRFLGYRESIQFTKDTEYQIDFTPLLSSSFFENAELEVYAVGPAFVNTDSDSDGDLETGKMIGKVTSNKSFQKFDKQQFNFKADETGIGDIIFANYQGNWHLANISLRAAAESSFSPNEITLNVAVPTKVKNDTFDFKFEFYDINNNYVPVSLNQEFTFAGGNDLVVRKSITVTPDGNLFSFSGSGESVGVSSINFDIEKVSLTGSTTFYSSAFDENGDYILPSTYASQPFYPGLLTNVTSASATLTVANFTGSLASPKVTRILYTASCEDVRDLVNIYRVDQGANGENGRDGSDGATFIAIANKSQFVYDPDNQFEPAQTNDFIDIKLSSNIISGSLAIASGSFLPRLQKLSTTQVGFYTESVYRIYSGDDNEDVAMLGTNAASWSYATPTNLIHKGTYLFTQNGFSASVQLEGVLKGDKSKNLNAVSNANQFFYKMTDVSLSPSGQIITIDVKRNNLGSNTNAITVTSGSGKPALTVGSNNGTTGVQSYSINGSNYPYSAGATTYTFFAEDLNFDDYTDTITITPVIAESQIAVNLSNENTSFPAYSGGIVFGGFLASSGSISVNVGSEDIAYSSTIANNRFSASISSSSNVTAVITNNNYSITALSADSGSINLKVTYRDGRGSDSVFTKLVSYSKAKAGTPNVLVAVSPQSQVLQANSLGVISSTPTSLVVTALESATNRLTSVSAQSSNATIGTISGGTIPITAVSADNASVAITASFTDSEGTSGTKFISATLSKAKAAPPTVVVSLDKDGQTITKTQSDSYGVPSPFRVTVAEGATAYTYDGSTPYGSSTFVITSVTNATRSGIDGQGFATIQPSTPSSTSTVLVSITGSYVNSEGSTTTFFKTHNVNVASDGTNGAQGASGPGVVLRGEYAAGTSYFYTTVAGSSRRDVVLQRSGGTTKYYATLQPTTGNAPTDGADNAYWQYLGNQDFFVAAKIGLFDDSFIKSTLNVGTNTSGNANITLYGGTDRPYISVAQAKQEFGTNGIYLGITGSVGNAVVSFQSGSNFFKYNSSAAGTVNDPVISVGGNIAATYITATSGAIGGFTLGANTLTAGSLLLDAGNNRILIGTGNSLVAMSPADGFYAGSATPADANFRVSVGGNMTARGANITGTITSNDGTIGGWSILDGRITKNNISLVATTTDEFINVQGSSAAGSAGNYVRITPTTLSAVTSTGAGDGVSSTAPGTSFTSLGTGTTLSAYFVGNSGGSTTLSTSAGDVSNTMNNGAAYNASVSVKYKLAVTFNATSTVVGEASIWDRPTYGSAQAAYQAGGFTYDNLIGVSLTANGARNGWNQALAGAGFGSSEYIINISAYDGLEVPVSIFRGDNSGTETITSTLKYTNGTTTTTMASSTKTFTLTGTNTEVSETVNMAGGLTQIANGDFRIDATRTSGNYRRFRYNITWRLEEFLEPDLRRPLWAFFPFLDDAEFETASSITTSVAPVLLSAGSLSRFIEITPSGIQAVFNSDNNYFRVDYVNGLVPGTSNFNIQSAGFWKHKGEIHSTGDIVGFTTAGASDERLKDSIQNVTDEDYLKLKELIPVTYSWKDDKQKEKHYGLIAQQVDKIFPELTRKKLFGEYMTINYIGLIPILVGMIQKQNSRISELERRLNSSK